MKEKQIGKEFVAGTLPSAQEICQKQLMKVIDDIEKVEVNEDMIAPFLPDIYRKYELMEKDDIVKKMVSMEFNKFLDYYKNAPEIVQPTGNGHERDVKGKKQKGGERRGERQQRTGEAEPGYTRLFINIGKMDGVNPRSFMGFLNRVSHGQQFQVGRIDLMKTFSFFEVPSEQAQAVLRTLNRAEYDGRPVNVEITEKSGGVKSQNPKRSERQQHPAERRMEKKSKRQPRQQDDNPFPPDYPFPKNKKGRPEWAQFFEGQVEDQPFYGQFTKKKKKK